MKFYQIVFYQTIIDDIKAIGDRSAREKIATKQVVDKDEDFYIEIRKSGRCLCLIFCNYIAEKRSNHINA